MKVADEVEAAELRLPEKVRIRLVELYRAKMSAEREFQGPMSIALEFFGLDPVLPHRVDFDTGIVTPVETSPAEAASKGE